MSAIEINTLLHVVEILAILGGGGGVLYRLGAFIRGIELALKRQTELFDAHAKDDLAIAVKHAADIADVRGKLERIADAMTTLAVQREQIGGIRIELNALRGDINDLRHGRGFIEPALR